MLQKKQEGQKIKLLRKFGELGHLGNGGRVVGADESVGVGGVANHQHLHRLLSLCVQGLPLYLSLLLLLHCHPCGGDPDQNS
jgi:hypothetical protein